MTFEYSTDNVSYTPLGDGTAAGSNWTLTGLSLPTGQNFYIRARGYYRSGEYNGSESITESVRNAGGRPQSWHEQLDSHQHHQRAKCTIFTHGGLDRRRNDRLGQFSTPPQSQHGREI